MRIHAVWCECYTVRWTQASQTILYDIEDSEALRSEYISSVSKLRSKCKNRLLSQENKMILEYTYKEFVKQMPKCSKYGNKMLARWSTKVDDKLISEIHQRKIICYPRIVSLELELQALDEYMFCIIDIRYRILIRLRITGTRHAYYMQHDVVNIYIHLFGFEWLKCTRMFIIFLSCQLNMKYSAR